MFWIIVLWVLQVWDWFKSKSTVRSIHDFYYFTNSEVTAYFYDYDRCKAMSKPNHHRYYLMNRDCPFVLCATLFYNNGSHEAVNDEFEEVTRILKGRLLHNIAFPELHLNDEELCMLSDILDRKIYKCELQICQ